MATPRQPKAIGQGGIPERIEDRLQGLAGKSTLEERPARDPAHIRSQIASLETRRLKSRELYTPTHPGVLQIDRQLNILRERLAAIEAAPAATGRSAP